MISSIAIVSDPKAIRKALVSARRAQIDWQREPIRNRARCAARFGTLLAQHAAQWMREVQVPQRLDRCQTLTSEIIPLCDGAKFLGRRAKRILATRWLGLKDRSWWLGRLDSVFIGNRGDGPDLGRFELPSLLDWSSSPSSLGRWQCGLFEAGSRKRKGSFTPFGSVRASWLSQRTVGPIWTRIQARVKPRWRLG